MSDVSEWHMHAGRRDGEFEHFGHPHYVRTYGLDPVAVTVTENPDGDYWGWLPSDADSPRMIYGREPLFRICFPYGVEAEEASGKGRMIRLDAKARVAT